MGAISMTKHHIFAPRNGPLGLFAHALKEYTDLPDWIGEELTMNPTIFREYDIRGIADKDFDQHFAYKLGHAYVSFAKKQLNKSSLNISVGRDCRVTGAAYAQALMSGLRDAGANVFELGPVTTPITYFSIFHKNLDGAIMVTGSHNPPDYNGFKICVGKSTIHGSDILELKALILQNSKLSYTPPSKPFEQLPIIEDYKSYVKSTVKGNALKVVIDAGNGSGGPIAPSLYRSMGYEVVELFCEPDGTFPNHEADPTVVANLQDLIAAVKKHKADVGIAFDGDADRIGAVNEKGEILWGDELMVIFSRDILKNSPGATIISEVKSSKRLYDDITKHGGKAIMWKTGHSLIKAKMKETKAALAGEMSGHMFFADRFFGFDDAIYAGARLLEIVAKSGKAMSALLADLPAAINTPEIRVECDDNKKWSVITNLKKHFSTGYQVTDIDGVRVEFADGWGLVRASNTQPVIVMRFEAQSQKRLDEIRQLVEAAARNAGLAI
jgi:phosphomannomutase/phosphoglucomutase